MTLTNALFLNTIKNIEKSLEADNIPCKRVSINDGASIVFPWSLGSITMHGASMHKEFMMVETSGFPFNNNNVQAYEPSIIVDMVKEFYHSIKNNKRRWW